MTQDSQEWLFIDSVRQFVDYLKENEPEEENGENAEPKYKFPQYKRIVWVLDKIDTFSSEAGIVRLLILCTVVVSVRGKYTKRKREQDT